MDLYLLWYVLYYGNLYTVVTYGLNLKWIVLDNGINKDKENNLYKTYKKNYIIK